MILVKRSENYIGMRKIYREIEYHKNDNSDNNATYFRLIFILGFIVLILSMCKPSNHSDVQIHYKSDTLKTDTLKNGN